MRVPWKQIVVDPLALNRRLQEMSPVNPRTTKLLQVSKNAVPVRPSLIRVSTAPTGLVAERVRAPKAAIDQQIPNSSSVPVGPPLIRLFLAPLLHPIGPVAVYLYSGRAPNAANDQQIPNSKSVPVES
jgi:hypothetical protein